MANLVVTSTTNSILVDFGAFPIGTMTKGVWRKNSIDSFCLTSDRIIIFTLEGSFEVCQASTTGALIIDSVDGAAPSSLADLYTKLSALIA